MTYQFYYIDENRTKTVYTNLTKRRAIGLYNQYLRDLAITNYRTIGWKQEK